MGLPINPLNVFLIGDSRMSLPEINILSLFITISICIFGKSLVVWSFKDDDDDSDNEDNDNCINIEEQDVFE